MNLNNSNKEITLCQFNHTNIGILYGMSADDPLPDICSCGVSITYADEVVFVSDTTYKNPLATDMIDCIFESVFSSK